MAAQERRHGRRKDEAHGLPDEDISSEDDTSDVTDEDSSWISWFCNLKGNDFFCEVDEDYIQDEFNMTGLAAQVPYYEYALDTILDIESPNADMLSEEQQEMVDSAAELLYGLIHARFILTTKGLNSMHEKFQEVDFGRCHRVYCQGQPVLPVGQSDIPRKATVNVYCPRCNDIYFPKSARQGNIDGAYFGTTFPHLFLMTFPSAVPPPTTMVYVPRVFGFRIHRESKREQVSTSRQEAAAILDASGGRGAGTEEVVVPSSVALVGGPAPASAGADVADITTGVAKLGVGPEDAGSPEEEAD